MPLEDLGRLDLAKRTEDGLGIRAAAKEVGDQPRDLSQSGKGISPRLGKLRKNPEMAQIADTLVVQTPPGGNVPHVHFRRKALLRRKRPLH